MGSTCSVARYDCKVYSATLNPLGDSGVSGSVIVYGDGDIIAYSGKGKGLEPDLLPKKCTEKNGTFRRLYGRMR